ncbi:MAG TPA: hypothetical protein VGT24_11545 [Candidatus Acidoferrales bacterium]|nr:hypothetical protein [Candidatus Acidoferrales bacterium]
MKRAIIFFILAILAASICALAQEGPNTSVVIQGMGVGIMAGKAGTVTGAPYSATITNESVQTLADGTRISQSGSGSIARDAQGRTRQDAPLPTIGNLSAENAPHLVIIMDPVAQVSYTLNLTEKTAQKMPMPPVGGPGLVAAMAPNGAPAYASGAFATGGAMMAGTNGPVTTAGPMPPPPPPGGGDALYLQSGSAVSGSEGGAPPPAMFFQKTLIAPDPSETKTEELGSQTIEGLLVNGTRTTRTIPIGEIGNDRPLNIVTEVWMSPDLKTIISSKRSDPRMGEQTFQLTNITRAEPDASLFTVPPDFKVMEGPQKVVYGINK